MKMMSQIPTLVVIKGLRGLRSISVQITSGPMSDKASGKCSVNHAMIPSRERKRSNSAVGANKVHVKDLSWEIKRREVGKEN